MSFDQRPGEIDHLLILRGLASLGVLVVHCLACTGPGVLSLRDLLAAEPVLADLSPTTGGNFVMCFFVLSGYLMGKVFLGSGRPLDRTGVVEFYKRRLLRVAPLLYFNLFFCMALYVHANPYTPATLGDFLFINNITDRVINPVTWSLSYEMQYYLLAPFVFLAFRKVSRANLLLVGLIAAALSLTDLYGHNAFLNVIRFLYLFLAGYLVNIAVRLWHPAKPRLGNLAGLVLFFASNFAYYYLFNTGRPFTASVVLAAAIAFCLWLFELPEAHTVARGPARHYFLRFWTWIGVLSYGIYLWHLPILQTQKGRLLEVAGAVGDKFALTGPWEMFLLFHGLQLAVVAFFALLLSFLTFIFVEARYRPNLYNQRADKLSSRIINVITLRNSSGGRQS